MLRLRRRSIYLGSSRRSFQPMPARNSSGSRRPYIGERRLVRPIFRPTALAVALSILLPCLLLTNTASADTYSLPYPFCNVNAASITTGGESTTGVVAVTLSGGNANAVACNGYSGYVGLAVLGGSASGQLAAIALGDGSSATATSSPIVIPSAVSGSPNPGVAIAPLGYASGGQLNIGCTASNDGTGTWVHWCPYFQDVNNAATGEMSVLAGFPPCNASNWGALYRDSLGTDWYCGSASISASTQPFYIWAPTLSTSVVLQQSGPPPLGGRSCRIQHSIATTGIAFRTINFDSNLTCTEPVLMEITSELRLVATNSLEASGTHFSGTSATGDSTGTFEFAVVGTQHQFKSFTRATTIGGALWVGTDSRCVGWGTISIYCVVSTTFTV
jgi:hypothetical protein